MSFETVLGTGALELTGTTNTDGVSMTMAREPVTGRRAFRMIHPPLTHPLTDAAILAIEVFGFLNPLPGFECRGGYICGAGTNPGFLLKFAAPVPLAGGDLVFEPVEHDGGTVDQLLKACSCETADVQSVQIRVHARLVENRERPLIHAPVFNICVPCGEVRE